MSSFQEVLANSESAVEPLLSRPQIDFVWRSQKKGALGSYSSNDCKSMFIKKWGLKKSANSAGLQLAFWPTPIVGLSPLSQRSFEKNIRHRSSLRMDGSRLLKYAFDASNISTFVRHVWLSDGFSFQPVWLQCLQAFFLEQVRQLLSPEIGGNFSVGWPGWALLGQERNTHWASREQKALIQCSAFSAQHPACHGTISGQLGDVKLSLYLECKAGQFWYFVSVILWQPWCQFIARADPPPSRLFFCMRRGSGFILRIFGFIWIVIVHARSHRPVWHSSHFSSTLPLGQSWSFTRHSPWL